MANGAAIAILEPDPAPPPSIPAPLPASSIEHQIGEATASATLAVAAAMWVYQQTGVLAYEAKVAGGNKIAAVAQLKLDYCGEPAFDVVARAQAKIILRRHLDHLDADFYSRHSPEQGVAAWDFYLDGLFEIVDRVVRLEKAMAN